MDSREVKAKYNEKTILVYQAYSKEIALAALEHGRFVPPFKMDRMTWIKPSFNWMMYRSGYGKKPGQEFVLAIEISRDGFDWALENAALSHFVAELHSTYEDWKSMLERSPVRVQWDPARDWRISEIAGERAIQIGLSHVAVQKYVNEWISSITDATPQAHFLDDCRRAKKEPSEHPDKLEKIYPIKESVRLALCPKSDL